MSDFPYPAAVVDDKEIVTSVPASLTSTQHRESQATALVRLAKEAGAEPFHTPAGDIFLTTPVNGHVEHHQLGSRSTRDYLARLLYQATGKAPSASALQDALATLYGIGRFDGGQHVVHTRVADDGHDARIHIDLCDADWQTVEITAQGWQIVSGTAVRFRRAKGILPLPVPEEGGSIDALRPFVNVDRDEDFVLIVAWLLAALRGRGPYPILIFMAEQGAAKTTTTRVLRRLVDPNESDVRRPPRNTEDLMVAATNGHVVAFDNLSRLPDDLSDNLSVLATGGGFAVRALYTNCDEQIFNAQRPIILNGISQVATRGDLLDRAVVVTLPPIPEEKRRDESTFWTDFEAARPRILGALFHAVGAGLRRVDHVRLERKPRMADFALWAVATEAACPWPEGNFLEAYAANRQGAIETTLEGDPLVDVVRVLPPWTGTAAELLAAVTAKSPEHLTSRKDWFTKPRQVADALRRLAPALRRTGIEVQFRRESHGRLIVLENLARASSSASSASSSPLPSPCINDADHGALSPSSTTSSSERGRVHWLHDAHDVRDACPPRLSGRAISRGEL